MSDEIKVGDVTQAKGVAIGAGAIAYNYEMQVNMPPELVRQMLAVSEREDFTRSELPHESWEPETILISAGPFLMGSQPGNGVPDWETPQFTLELPACRIGKYPVTNGEFAEFVRKTEASVSTAWRWQDGNQPAAAQRSQPITGVTWYDALAYCLWLVKETKRPYTLPSEAQWEKAARVPDGRLFPWGDDWQDGANCNVDCKRLTDVDAFPDGASPFGCMDMVGNAREWTTTLWGRQRHFLGATRPIPANIPGNRPGSRMKKWMNWTSIVKFGA